MGHGMPQDPSHSALDVCRVIDLSSIFPVIESVIACQALHSSCVSITPPTRRDLPEVAHRVGAPYEPRVITRNMPDRRYIASTGYRRSLQLREEA